MENIYQAIIALDELALPPRSAAFAGNVALTFGARGGVYIAGGISPRIVGFLARSEFRNRFEAKGRLQPYLEAIPSYVIVHPAALPLYFLD